MQFPCPFPLVILQASEKNNPSTRKQVFTNLERVALCILSPPSHVAWRRREQGESACQCKNFHWIYLKRAAYGFFGARIERTRERETISSSASIKPSWAGSPPSTNSSQGVSSPSPIARP